MAISKKKITKVVLAYSGGLDTSTIVPWLKENYGDCEVVAYCADVGQGAEELEGVEEKAIASGASSCHVADLKAEFAKDYIWPSLTTGATYEGDYLLGTALARPVIAKGMVELALEIGADAIAHGCTGKGNDQVRFESTVAALAPQLQVIAPWREWDLQSREDCLDYLAARNIPCSASLEKIYSRDANLWHISHEGAELEDPWCEPTDQVWTWTVSPEQAPDAPTEVTLSVKHGRVTAVNGQELIPEQVVVTLNEIAAANGVGRIDIVENRLVGMKSRGCYETPGGTVIQAALRGIEQLTLDKTTLKFREQLGAEFAHLLYDGRWFTPLRDAILAASESIAQYVNGEVVLKLYKGQCQVIKRQSPNSLYSEAFATFGEDEVYDQSHAEGFIRLYSLSSRIRAMASSGERPDMSGHSTTYEKSDINLG